MLVILHENNLCANICLDSSKAIIQHFFNSEYVNKILNNFYNVFLIFQLVIGEYLIILIQIVNFHINYYKLVNVLLQEFLFQCKKF